MNANEGAKGEVLWVVTQSQLLKTMKQLKKCFEKDGKVFLKAVHDKKIDVVKFHGGG